VHLNGFIARMAAARLLLVVISGYTSSDTLARFNI